MNLKFLKLKKSSDGFESNCNLINILKICCQKEYTMQIALFSLQALLADFCEKFSMMAITFLSKVSFYIGFYSILNYHK